MESAGRISLLVDDELDGISSSGVGDVPDGGGVDGVLGSGDSDVGDAVVGAGSLGGLDGSLVSLEACAAADDTTAVAAPYAAVEEASDQMMATVMADSAAIGRVIHRLVAGMRAAPDSDWRAPGARWSMGSAVQ